MECVVLRPVWASGSLTVSDGCRASRFFAIEDCRRGCQRQHEDRYQGEPPRRGYPADIQGSDMREFVQQHRGEALGVVVREGGLDGCDDQRPSDGERCRKGLPRRQPGHPKARAQPPG